MDYGCYNIFTFVTNFFLLLYPEISRSVRFREISKIESHCVFLCGF